MCLCKHRNMNVITPPQPHPQKGACVCWTARKIIRFVVPVCVQEHECYYPTPPHPPERCLCLLDSKKDDKVCCTCVCTGTWTLLPYPTPSRERCLCLLDSKKDDKVCCACVCTGTRTLLPNPTPSPERCLCLLDSKKHDKVCCACMCTGTRTLLPYPTPSPRKVPVSAGQQER